MTPHIVEADEDYEFIKMMESERMSWCLGDVVEVHGNVGLQGNHCVFCPDDVPVIYPDQDPTGVLTMPGRPTAAGGDYLPAEGPPVTDQGGGEGQPFAPVPQAESEEQIPESRVLTEGQPTAARPLRPAAPYHTARVTYGPPPPSSVRAAQFALPIPSPAGGATTGGAATAGAAVKSHGVADKSPRKNKLDQKWVFNGS